MTINDTTLEALLDLGPDAFVSAISAAASPLLTSDKLTAVLALERNGPNRTPYVQALCDRLGVASPYESYSGGPAFTNSNAQALASAIIAADTAILSRSDCKCDTTAAVVSLTLPAATANAFFRVSNCPVTDPGNVVKLIQSGTNKIRGPNPITALTRVTTTVTMATLRPHSLTTSDFVTVTGATPSGYNRTNQAVASVVDANTITYAAASDPGANTVLGVFDTALVPGEERGYRCVTAGTWARGRGV